MKKTYLKPELNIVSVGIHHILAGSLEGSTPGEEYTETDITYSRRRSISVWDDDDDEDFE